MTTPKVDDLSAVHLIGAGGAGMSALARVLVAKGSRVSGSDIKGSKQLTALRAIGVRTAVGHRAANIDGASVIVVSSAIAPANPEILAAQDLGLPVLQRAQVLAMLMRERRGIAVAGTHGKTTTTSMIAMALRRAGLDPSFLIGGDVNEIGTNAHHGAGEWLVAEADESDGSFLWLTPDVAVVTNIEADHLDYYRNVSQIMEAFSAFVANVRPGGSVVVCADDAGAMRAVRGASCNIVTYGLEPGSTWAGTVTERGPDGTRVHVERDGVTMGELRLAVSGDHNVRNALAALAVAGLAGADPTAAAEELASFGGVARRFELRGRAGGVSVVDDYAHHPTELRATLAGARDRGYQRLIAVFQPHRFSRTAAMGKELGAALSAADLVVVTDVYGAGEAPVPGVNGKMVLDGLLEETGRAIAAYLPARRDIAPFVASRVRPGDLVLTLGAGDVTMLAGDILDHL